VFFISTIVGIVLGIFYCEGENDEMKAPAEN